LELVATSSVGRSHKTFLVQPFITISPAKAVANALKVCGPKKEAAITLLPADVADWMTLQRAERAWVTLGSAMRIRAALLVSVFIVGGVAACRRAPPPAPHAAGSGNASAPDLSSALPDASVDAFQPALSAGDADVAVKDECADSSECAAAAGAICCRTARAKPQKRDVTNPFFQVEYSLHAICTATPEKDCDSLELCKGASCRIPKPAKRQVHCGAGGLICTEPTPLCVLDLERPAGEKVRPPTCVRDDREAVAAIPSTSSVFACAKSEDCPRGAHCVLTHFPFIGRFDGECAFKPRPPAHGKTTAPICREQSECAKLTEGYSPNTNTSPSRCRPLRVAPTTVRMCEVSGNAHLF